MSELLYSVLIPYAHETSRELTPVLFFIEMPIVSQIRNLFSKSDLITWVIVLEGSKLIVIVLKTFTMVLNTKNTVTLAY